MEALGVLYAQHSGERDPCAGLHRRGKGPSGRSAVSLKRTQSVEETDATSGC